MTIQAQLFSEICMLIMQAAHESFPQPAVFRTPAIAKRHAILQARASLYNDSEEVDFSTVYISLEQAVELLESSDLDHNLVDFFDEYCALLEESEDEALDSFIGEIASGFPTRERFFGRIYDQALSFLLAEGICRRSTPPHVNTDSSEQEIGLSILGAASLTTELQLSTRKEFKNHPKIIDMANKAYRTGVKSGFQRCFRAAVEAIGLQKVAPRIPF